MVLSVETRNLFVNQKPIYNLKEHYQAKLLSLLIISCLFSMKSYSQYPDKKTTVDSLNSWMRPITTIELNGSNVIIKSYDEKGKFVKEDKAPFADLTVTPYYEEESNLICIPCLKDADGCVTRSLIVQKIRRQFNRISFTPSRKEDYSKIKKALQHLIRIQSEVGYKDSVSLDTE